METQPNMEPNPQPPHDPDPEQSLTTRATSMKNTQLIRELNDLVAEKTTLTKQLDSQHAENLHLTNLNENVNFEKEDGKKQNVSLMEKLNENEEREKEQRKQIDKMEEAIRKLQKQLAEPPKNKYFKPKTGLVKKKNKNNNTQDSVEGALTSLLTQPRLLHIIEEQGKVLGLTTLYKELLILTDSKFSKLKIFCSKTFQKKRSINVPDLQKPVNMAACESHNCVYISDSETRKIYKHHMTTEMSSSWPSGGFNAEPGCVSVTHELNVLVVLVASREIVEYTTDGSLVRLVSLGETIESPRQALEMTQGVFVVSHGWDYDKPHRVCVVDSTGAVVQSYGGLAGSAPGHMDRYRSLALVGKSPHQLILVADYYNNRVEVVKAATLKRVGYVGSLPGGEELKYPSTIQWEESGRRLYIGDSGGRVFVLTTYNP